MTAALRRALPPVLLAIAATLGNEAHARTLVLAATDARASAAVGTIVDGAREGVDVDVRFIAPSALASTVATATDTHDAIVLVGRELIDEGIATPDDTALLLGGFYGSVAAPPGSASISLNVDPAYALEQADKTGARVADVWTVLSPDRADDPDVRRLETLGSRRRHIAVARGERETARAWFDATLDVEPPEGAIVVFDDRFLDTSGTWRYLTERAWRDEVLLISTLPNYARRGVAIGFVPDLRDYGRLLVRAARRMAEEADYVPAPLLDASTLQRVFNTRTLEHIGRRLPADLDRLGRDDIVIDQ